LGALKVGQEKAPQKKTMWEKGVGRLAASQKGGGEELQKKRQCKVRRSKQSLLRKKKRIT